MIVAPVITIDGPSGSDKGTIAGLLAKQLGWNLLDSGALYRLLAFAAGIAMVVPNSVFDFIGLALIVVLAAVHYVSWKNSPVPQKRVA